MPDEPFTEAGRALLYDPDEGYPAGLEEHMPEATGWRDGLRKHIVAIENEARMFGRAERVGHDSGPNEQ